MIRLAVINLKDLLKNLVKAFVIFILIVIFIRFIKLLDFKGIELKFQEMKTYSYVDSIEKTVVLASDLGTDSEKNEDELTSSGKILATQFSIFKNDSFNKMLIDVEEDVVEVEHSTEDIVAEVNSNEFENINTSVVQENNITERYTDVYNTTKIKNESSYALTESMVNPDFNLANNKDILIFHTHTCESYTPTEQLNYEMTGLYRTTDLNYTVARVGEELKNHMTQKRL